MSSERSRQPLPFEPAKNRKKASKTQPTSGESNTSSETSAVRVPPQKASKKKQASVQRKRPADPAEMQIPEVVSRRMLSRMAILAGVPLFMAVGVFVASYFIVINELLILPNTAVLLVSLGCFGLSVIGLSYGIFSASWDEEVQGSVLGLQEFKLNLGRTVAAWKASRQEARSKIKN